MSDVPRYSCDLTGRSPTLMVGSRDGEWVSYTHYDALARQLEAVKAKLQVWHDHDDAMLERAQAAEHQLTEGQRTLEELYRAKDSLSEQVEQAQAQLERQRSYDQQVIDGLMEECNKFRSLYNHAIKMTRLQSQQRIAALEAKLAVRDAEAAVTHDALHNAKGLHLRLEQAAARLAALESMPNNVVACASCHAPVQVTALNAIRCEKCGPTPEAQARLAEVTAACRALIQAFQYPMMDHSNMHQAITQAEAALARCKDQP